VNDRISLTLVDEQSAREEALHGPEPASRSAFLKKLAAGGTVLAGGVLFAGLPAAARANHTSSASRDVSILNFALTLEYLEAEFYTEAENRGALSGEPLRFARVVGAHERAHVQFLRRVLGSRARQKPCFDFGDTTSNQDKFLATARVLEDTGVAAYNGQIANVRTATVAPAASIVSVEARHAAWVRDILGLRPAPSSLDQAKSRRQIESEVAATGFVVSCP
jgi:hypothetical protein